MQHRHVQLTHTKKIKELVHLSQGNMDTSHCIVRKLHNIQKQKLINCIQHAEFPPATSTNCIQ